MLVAIATTQSMSATRRRERGRNGLEKLTILHSTSYAPVRGRLEGVGKRWSRTIAGAPSGAGRRKPSSMLLPNTSPERGLVAPPTPRSKPSSTGPCAPSTTPTSPPSPAARSGPMENERGTPRSRNARPDGRGHLRHEAPWHLTKQRIPDHACARTGTCRPSMSSGLSAAHRGVRE